MYCVDAVLNVDFTNEWSLITESITTKILLFHIWLLCSSEIIVGRINSLSSYNAICFICFGRIKFNSNALYISLNCCIIVIHWLAISPNPLLTGMWYALWTKLTRNSVSIMNWIWIRTILQGIYIIYRCYNSLYIICYKMTYKRICHLLQLCIIFQQISACADLQFKIASHNCNICNVYYLNICIYSKAHIHV